MFVDEKSGTAIAIALAPDDFWWLIVLQFDAPDIGIGRVSTAAGVQAIAVEERRCPVGSHGLGGSSAGIFPEQV